MREREGERGKERVRGEREKRERESLVQSVADCVNERSTAPSFPQKEELHWRRLLAQLDIGFLPPAGFF